MPACATQKTIADQPPISNLFLPVPDTDFRDFLDEIAELSRFVPEIITAIEGDPDWATTTSIIVVADHGGPSGQLLHGDPTLAENYTIPFVVWGPSVSAAADLYSLNTGNRSDPGTRICSLPYRGQIKKIR